MKNTLKKLPFLLAFVVTIFAASCSDIAVEPVNTEDDNDGPIIITPKPPGSQSAATSDTTSIG